MKMTYSRLICYWLVTRISTTIVCASPNQKDLGRFMGDRSLHHLIEVVRTLLIFIPHAFINIFLSGCPPLF